uniref:Uncharacterized protein n=1 Tax=Ciona intestinalis TaxID=7719 RepID=H2XTD0_CIOIN
MILLKRLFRNAVLNTLKLALGNFTGVVLLLMLSVVYPIIRQTFCSKTDRGVIR